MSKYMSIKNKTLKGNVHSSVHFDISVQRSQAVMGKHLTCSHVQLLQHSADHVNGQIAFIFLYKQWNIGITAYEKTKQNKTHTKEKKSVIVYYYQVKNFQLIDVFNKGMTKQPSGHFA